MLKVRTRLSRKFTFQHHVAMQQLMQKVWQKCFIHFEMWVSPAKQVDSHALYVQLNVNKENYFMPQICLVKSSEVSFLVCRYVIHKDCALAFQTPALSVRPTNMVFWEPFCKPAVKNAFYECDHV